MLKFFVNIFLRNFLFGTLIFCVAPEALMAKSKCDSWYKGNYSDTIFWGRGTISALSYCIQKVGINHRDYVGSTPLHSAISHHNPKIENIRFLLEQGANVNTERRMLGKKTTPLHSMSKKGNYSASQKKQSEIIFMLLEYGANINAKNESGQTAAEVYAGSDEKVLTALSTGISIAKKKNLISSKTKTTPPSKYTEPPNTLQNFTKSDFLQLSVQQRKQLQYALKELGYYTSSIDGLYGPNTQRAVRAYAKNKGINRNYPISILSQLKAEVSVPSSFATAKKTTSNAVKQGSTKSHYNGLKPLVSNPSLSAKQAWIKCATRANTAHRNAYKSYSTPKYGSTTNCTLNATRTGIIINGNLDCESSPQHGGFVGGITNTLGRASVAKAAAESTMSSCLTKHGWKR